MSAMNDATMKAKEWFDSLQPRERRIVVAGAVIVAIMFLYLLIWDPLVSKINSLEKSNQENQKLITWMEQSAAEVQKLQAKINAGRPMNRSKGQSLLGIIDRTAKQAKLNNSMSKVQPDGKNGAKVWLEDVSFNDMIKWLEQLQRREGIHIDTTVIERRDTSGLVNARLDLQGAG